MKNRYQIGLVYSLRHGSILPRDGWSRFDLFNTGFLRPRVRGRLGRSGALLALFGGLLQM